MQKWTTIEQGKALEELIDNLGADMYYDLIAEPEQYGYPSAPCLEDDFGCFVPCWTLGALVELLPTELTIEGDKRLRREMNVCGNHVSVQYVTLMEGVPVFSITSDDGDLFTCVYNMVFDFAHNEQMRKQLETAVSLRDLVYAGGSNKNTKEECTDE